MSNTATYVGPAAGVDFEGRGQVYSLDPAYGGVMTLVTVAPSKDPAEGTHAAFTAHEDRTTDFDSPAWQSVGFPCVKSDSVEDFLAWIGYEVNK